MDDFTPQPQPSGALVPPTPPGPPTAIALLTPEPPPPRRERMPYMRDQALWNLIKRTLDAVDGVADTIAEGLGIR